MENKNGVKGFRKKVNKKYIYKKDTNKKIPVGEGFVHQLEFFIC